jgi:hypothetical protein
LITRTLLGDEYRSLSSPLCSRLATKRNKHPFLNFVRLSAPISQSENALRVFIKFDVVGFISICWHVQVRANDG